MEIQTWGICAAKAQDTHKERLEKERHRVCELSTIPCLDAQVCPATAQGIIKQNQHFPAVFFQVSEPQDNES